MEKKLPTLFYWQKCQKIFRWTVCYPRTIKYCLSSMETEQVSTSKLLTKKLKILRCLFCDYLFWKKKNNLKNFKVLSFWLYTQKYPELQKFIVFAFSLCFWENSKNSLCLFLIHLGDLHDIMSCHRSPLSFSTTWVTCKTPCHAIGIHSHFSPKIFIGKQKIFRCVKHPENVRLPTYLAFLQRKCISWKVLFMC